MQLHRMRILPSLCCKLSSYKVPLTQQLLFGRILKKSSWSLGFIYFRQIKNSFAYYCFDSGNSKKEINRFGSNFIFELFLRLSLGTWPQCCWLWHFFLYCEKLIFNFAFQLNPCLGIISKMRLYEYKESKEYIIHWLLGSLNFNFCVIRWSSGKKNIFLMNSVWTIAMITIHFFNLPSQMVLMAIFVFWKSLDESFTSLFITKVFNGCNIDFDVNSHVTIQCCTFQWSEKWDTHSAISARLLSVVVERDFHDFLVG